MNIDNVGLYINQKVSGILDNNRKKFPEEYWCYYNLWASALLECIKSEPNFIDSNKLIDMCNILDLDLESVKTVIRKIDNERKSKRYTSRASVFSNNIHITR